MVFKLAVLFFTPLVAGLLIFPIPKIKSSRFRLLLVFAGSYLFGITVVHLLPELYVQNEEVALIGLFVLAGFFLQQMLEFFTTGVEHGHIHGHHHGEVPHAHDEPGIKGLMLLGALCVHAFLEGGMLTDSVELGVHYDTNAILLGIVLHRAPAAFALMTVLAHQLHSKKKALPHLIVFSLAAPLGLIVSDLIMQSTSITNEVIIYLYAVVCGNFLHISTTIVFESSPDHHFNGRKLAIAILGAFTAVLIEYVL
jgi:zinc transporter ZupT